MENKNISNISNLSLDRIPVKNFDFSKKKGENKIAYNKKIEIINRIKSDMSEEKKLNNKSHKTVPISPIDNNKKHISMINKLNKINQNLKHTNSTESNPKTQNTYSYTLSKLQENQYNQSQVNQNYNKKPFIKGLDLCEKNKSKKKISSDIDANSGIIEKNNINNIDKNNLNIIKVNSSYKVLKDDNTLKINENNVKKTKVNVVDSES